MNLIAEDLVRLLLREQEINRDKQNLQERLDKSMSQADIAALGLAVRTLFFQIEIQMKKILMINKFPGRKNKFPDIFKI